jgi:pyruvate formate lyase activating enzyme
VSRSLRIGGLTPLTSIDCPGRLAAVVFLQGCPWRCDYCHNQHLRPADGPCTLSWDHVRAFLQRRRGLLDAVVFSGGEPTLQPGLTEAAREARALGFQVGLHTAGMYPERLAQVLPSLDWVGLDIKAPMQEYDAVTGVPGSGDKVRRSLAHVLRSGISYECRTTWHEELFGADRLQALADTLADIGVSHWVVQTCRTAGRAHAAPPPSDLARLRRRFSDFGVR